MTTMKSVKHQQQSSKTKTSTRRKRTLRNTIRSRKQTNKQRKHQTKKRNRLNKGGGPLTFLYDKLFKLSKEWRPIHQQAPPEGFKISNIIAIGSFRYQNNLKIHRHKLFCVYKNPNNGGLVLYCKSMPWRRLSKILTPLTYITKLFNPFGLLFALGVFYRHLTRLDSNTIEAEQVIINECGFSTSVEGADYASVVAQDSSLLLTSGIASAVEFLVPWLIIGFTANKIFEFASKQVRAEDVWDVWKTKNEMNKHLKRPNVDENDKLKVLEYINLINHRTHNLYKKWYAVTKNPKMEMDLSFENENIAFAKIVYGEHYALKTHGLCTIDWIKRVDSYVTTKDGTTQIIDIKNENNMGKVNNNKLTLNGLTTTAENGNTNMKLDSRQIESAMAYCKEQNNNESTPLLTKEYGEALTPSTRSRSVFRW